MVLNYYARNYSESLAPAFIIMLQRYKKYSKLPNILATFFEILLSHRNHRNHRNFSLRLLCAARAEGTFCDFCDFCVTLLIISDSDLVAGRAEGRPRDVEPGAAREQLVGVFPRLEKVHQALELGRILWPDVGGLANEVLRVPHATHLAVHGLATETRIDDDGPHNESGGLQQHDAAIGQVRHGLHGRNVLWVLAQPQELTQLKVRR